MTRDELIAALQSIPADLDVCVTTDRNREVYLAVGVELFEIEEYGVQILIEGAEEVDGPGRAG